jgi:CheY-like chemotaxis protein
MANTILIVDDEKYLIRLFVRVFEREGYRVLTAPDGTAALECLAEQAGSIDVLVLDVVIPPDGPEPVLDAVSADPQEIGVVMVSGAPPPPNLQMRLGEMGGVFIQKPFRPDVLVEAVEGLVPPTRTGDT